jgi:hypothetical protein
VEVTLLGQQISIERIGTDGDVAKATQLFTELDGKVDALGVGGIDLGMTCAGRYYPLYQAQKLTANVRRTPVVDGGGLKHTLERRLAQVIEREIGDFVQPKRVMITAGVDRYGSVLSFHEAGYEILAGDLGFGLGIPIPIRSLRALNWAARLILPIAGRFPLDWLYPTGEKQEVIVPKFEKWYAWAKVICGDCLYVKRHMPDDLEGKVIATNTTTESDVEAFRQRGVAYLVTATPRLDGRSFGTNMMEAALVAVADKGRTLEHEELEALLSQLNMEPTVHKLND